MSQPIVSYGQDEISHLRSQNDQLWKIIEKQRAMIQNLQKDNVRLSAERDGLQDQLHLLEKEMTRKQRVTSLLISPQALREIAEADDASTPNSETTPSPIESYTTTPMPPPRSPYRPLKERPDEIFNKQGIEQRMEEPESYLTARNLEDINGRSSPGSPAPGPHSPTRSYQQRKDSAPLPNHGRSHSPYMLPAPSKSSSSLEVRRRQRDSMMPPPRAALEHDPTMRAASPPLPPSFSSSTASINTNLMTASTSTSTINSISNSLHVTSTQQKRHSQLFTTNSLTDLHQQEEEEEEEKPALMGNMANVHVKVVGSNIKPNDKGKEVVSFIVSVGHYREDDTHRFEERWRVEKLYSDFLSLDTKLKTQRNRAVSGKIGKLPDKALFSNNAPTKVDQRKAALEQYLQHVISLSLEDPSDLCEFLSTNVVDTKVFQAAGQKEGYLTKRGKNFGGWKTRYFVLNESVLEYYESKEGTQLGSIRLTNAQIGTQMHGSSPANEESNSVYRHAFLIVEQKRVGSSHSVRHILCANSDDDRDNWVHALLQNISIVEEDVVYKKKKAEKPRKLSKGEIRAISAQPISHMKLDNSSQADMDKLSVPPHAEEDSQLSSSLPSVQYNTWSSYEAGRVSLDQRSSPSNLNLQPRPPIVRRSSMSNLIEQPPPADPLRRAVSPTILPREDSPTESLEPEKKARNKAHRMTFWGKKMLFNNTTEEGQPQQTTPRPAPSNSSSSSTTTTSNPSGFRGFLSRSSHEQNDRQRKQEETPSLPKPSKQVFGVPLEEAVRISRVSEGYELPAVVYRCIEYLDAMNAVMEEGIYRLSGSNSTQKALRERFNQEGDVNLMATKDDYDVHVVAGLLKMWLRELPTSVLTREHRIDFLHVIDLLDRKDRVNELGRLVSLLPLANYTLLRALTAHLIRVVQHSDVNKMTMRNVSIVFSPTLGIPATIFNLFMSEFEYIFWITKDGDAAPRMIEDDNDDKEEEEESAPGLSRSTTLRLREEHGRSNRNSVNYMDGAPNAIVDLEKHMDGKPF
ncbi:uncharacterized protein B0P05DRAFT_527663 [Gilbertella persicaria]|uniref:uncharacterized protein n=1 Tax=Gilbertella persicaria TaxID=101096 RepID=UPI00221EA4F0|nr:uncharacterized protein B0P05DRAFT_527663 [Gilbertella persicaria]KAI8091463.1 hypothetical protein B0P05DRAFT_527663 [Gilbertella persicaria]